MNIWPIALFSLLAATAAHAQVTEVDAGQWHTCALLTGGAIKCWGYNYNGQLGDGTTTDSTTPIDVSGISTATSIALGDSHSCALLTGGAVKCWGYNGDNAGNGLGGQLGDGTTTDSAVPVDVSGISTATSIALGTYHSCAVLSGGAVKCWGHNSRGELGDGTEIHRPAPVDVLDITSAKSVALGWQRATPVDVVGLYAPPPPPPPPNANATVALDDDDRAAGLAGILVVLVTTTINVLFTS